MKPATMSTNNSISKPLVNQKLKGMIKDLKELKELLSHGSYEKIASDERSLTLGERYLERVINRAIDVNFHLIRVLGQAPPDTYADSFRVLVRLHVLPPALAKNLAPSGGTRNILIHEYDDLDTHKLFTAFQKAVKYYPQYAKAIERFVEKQKNGA